MPDTVQVITERPPSHVRAIAAANNRAALRLEAQSLLDAQAEMSVSRRSYTLQEADLIQQAVREGALNLKGLHEIRVEDHSGRKAIHFVGDDDGEWMASFMNPLKIGRFATEPDKQFARPKSWWQR